MKFLIYDKQRNCYLRAAAGTPTWVAKTENASKYKSRLIAEAAIKERPMFFKGFLENLTIVEFTEEGDANPIPPEVASEFVEQLTNAMSTIVNCTDNLAGLCAYVSQELSHYDLMQEDILHKIELSPVVGITSLKLMKQLREIRKNRRKVKDTLTLIKIFTDTGIIQRIKEYKSSLETRTYTPRVLTELFKEEEK